MRYCFVLPFFDEQKNSFSKLLAPLMKTLLEKGHEVAILSGNTQYQGPWVRLHHALNISLRGPAFLHFLLFISQTTFWLWRNGQRFDIIHNLGVGSSLYQNVLTAHACHRAWLRVKWQNRQYVSLFLNPLHLLVWAVETFNYRRPIPVIAVCQRLADEIAHYYPFTKDRLTVINNGVSPMPRTASLPRSSDFTISFASNDHRKKGLKELLDALAMAHQESRPWKLWVLGNDPKQSMWERYAASKGLQDHVQFKGHVLNIHDYFASSDVFCLPSHYEPFGLVYVEAAQTGIPVVGTEVGVYPDLVEGFSSIPPLPLPLKAHDLYLTLKRLADQPTLRSLMGQHVQRQAGFFSDQTMVDRQLAFYESLSLSKRNIP